MYGVGKFYCGNDLISPIDDLQQILKLNSLDRAHDLRFAFSNAFKIPSKNIEAFRDAIINETRFEHYVKHVAR